MGSIKVKLTDGSREIELEGEFADVQQLLALWWSQAAPAAGGSGPGGRTGTGTGGSTSAGKADHIAADTRWSGTVTVDRATTVDPGVTLTIAAGTVVTIKSPASLIIAGNVDIQGTGAAKVTLAAPTPVEGHGGLSVLGGGELRMHHGLALDHPAPELHRFAVEGRCGSELPTLVSPLIWRPHILRITRRKCARQEGRRRWRSRPLSRAAPQPISSCLRWRRTCPRRAARPGW